MARAFLLERGCCVLILWLAKLTNGAGEAWVNNVSVAISVAEAMSNSDKYWSEWQDLNLRPPRPERGGAQRRGWGPLGFYI